MDNPVSKVSIPQYFSILVTVAGVVVGVLNVYIVSKLAPLAESVAVLSQRVEAHDKELTDTVGKVEIESMQRQMNSIDGKVDYLIQLHVKK